MPAPVDVRRRHLVLALNLFTLAAAFAAMSSLLTADGTGRYGGIAAFAASVLVELVSSVLIAPVVALSITLFLLGLVCGRSVAWGGQNRGRLDYCLA